MITHYHYFRAFRDYFAMIDNLDGIAVCDYALQSDDAEVIEACWSAVAGAPARATPQHRPERPSQRPTKRPSGPPTVRAPAMSNRELMRSLGRGEAT